MTWDSLALVGGILLPADVLQESWFRVLAAFVAVNTLVYMTLAVLTVLPRAYPGRWWRRRRDRNA